MKNKIKYICTIIIVLLSFAQQMKSQHNTDINIDEIMRKAEYGDAVSQYQLAAFYHKGYGIKEDQKLAYFWGLKAAKQDLAQAQYLVGYLYANGQGVTKNLANAIIWWKKCANHENDTELMEHDDFKFCVANAQLFLGYCYIKEEEVEKDPSEAFVWMNKAAKNGNIDAMWNVGLLYHDGIGVSKDLSKAYDFLQKAADKGSPDGAFYLGLMYLDGDFVKKDEVKAFYWTQKAAESGFTTAELMLGSLYYKQGVGTKQDYKKANEWLTKAANKGVPQALCNLGWSYYLGQGVSKNYSEALRLFSKATEKNYPDGYNGIAYCKFYGFGTKKNEDEAISLINKAIELSNNDNRFLDTKGEFYCKLGYVDKAKEIYEHIVNNDSTYYNGTSNSYLAGYFNNLQHIDTDDNIPCTTANSKNVFAVIIANEKYQSEKTVQYANRDGKIFSEYCNKTLGIPEKNIHFISNATLNNIKHEIKWLQDVINAYNGDSRIIFYYAGHGIPDEKNKSAYLLPVDGYGSDVTTGYALEDLYKSLGSQPSKSVTVFLDACFSGANRDGNMLASARGIAIKVKSSSPTGNMVVFTAAQGDETAYPYKERSHGLFTYYLLKKLQETKGNVTLGELGDYIQTQVRRQSVVTNGKIQSPSILVSPNIGNSWKSWKLK